MVLRLIFSCLEHLNGKSGRFFRKLEQLIIRVRRRIGGNEKAKYGHHHAQEDHDQPNMASLFFSAFARRNRTMNENMNRFSFDIP